jgi:hypothetical protein
MMKNKLGVRIGVHQILIPCLTPKNKAMSDASAIIEV